MVISIESLLTQLRSHDARDRSAAVLQLAPGAFDDAAAITMLLDVLCTDGDLNVVEDATWVLARHGDGALSALLDTITHGDSRARHNVVHALGKIGDRRAVPAPLVPRLKPIMRSTVVRWRKRHWRKLSSRSTSFSAISYFDDRVCHEACLSHSR